MSSSPATELARARIVVYGLVQGVFFRGTMRREALKRGVTGWVRNRPDGAVEAVLEGPKTAVEWVLQWASVGPAAAVVENVKVEWDRYEGQYTGFAVQ